MASPLSFRKQRSFPRQLSRNIRMLQTERDSWLLWNRARDTLNNTRQDLPEVVSVHSLTSITYPYVSGFRFPVVVIV